METKAKWLPIDERNFMFQVIWPNDTYYNRLKELQEKYPELTYDNKGWEGLPLKVLESRKKELEEITEICRQTVAGFSSFNHFKRRANGDIVLRLQYTWAVSPHFTGVGYFYLEFWDEKFHAECVFEEEERQAKLNKYKTKK